MKPARLTRQRGGKEKRSTTIQPATVHNFSPLSSLSLSLLSRRIHLPKPERVRIALYHRNEIIYQRNKTIGRCNNEHQTWRHTLARGRVSPRRGNRATEDEEGWIDVDLSNVRQRIFIFLEVWISGDCRWSYPRVKHRIEIERSKKEAYSKTTRDKHDKASSDTVKRKR